MADRELARKETLPVREADWDRTRSQLALRGVHGRLRRAQRVQRAGYVALSLAACALACVALFERSAPPVAHQAAPVTAIASKPLDTARTLRFPDGSAVELADAHAVLDMIALSPERIEVSLTSGKAHFRVAPAPTSTFVVRVASFAMHVMASEFTVTRETTRMHVHVATGQVRIEGPSGVRVLERDEAAFFALDAAPPAPLRELPRAHDEARAPDVDRGAARARFLEHARAHDYREAMAVVRAKPSVVHDTPEDLMLAADAARLSGDARAAVPFLRRVMDEHAKDARAPLAAFTLGRILLGELAQPGEAQRAFARTRALSPQGSLAEDALAREVEAAKRAGHTDDARSLAAEYLARYPQGRRRDEVQRVASP